MTNEEYQQLFPWNEYTTEVHDGGLDVSFGEKHIPLSFKIGDTEFMARCARYPETHYASQVGISLTLRCPQPQVGFGELSYVGTWVAHKEGPFYSYPQHATPMQALESLRDWLHKSALRGQQDQRDHDIVSAMLTGK